MAPLGLPVDDTSFHLDSAAVAGFFGGEEAIEAMATVHLYEGRRWLGWFNSPGSYKIAKRFGRMANSRLWDGLFPGTNDSPEVSFGLDGKKGPEYIAPLSGTHIKSTGHLAYLTMLRSKEVKAERIQGRVTKPFNVAYLAMNHVDYDSSVERLPCWGALPASIPICVSIVTCLMCALAYDWFSFSMILLGIVSSGLASFVIGKGRLMIKSVANPASGAPPGHGILKGEDDVVVIKGRERDVNAITKGAFDLQTDPLHADKKQGDIEKALKKDDEENAVRRYHFIGTCSFLLLVLLVPQGHLFGQIMFITSLVTSWGYNSYLSSLEKEKIQTQLLFQKLGKPVMQRFRAGTRTTMAVFVCLLLFHDVQSDKPKEEQRKLRAKILGSCLPNDTDVWKRWTDKVVDLLLDVNVRTGALQPSFPPLSQQILTRSESSSPSLEKLDLSPSEQSFFCISGGDRQLEEKERDLLVTLLGDADAAFKKYFAIHEKLPKPGPVLVQDGQTNGT